jgi:hypothetical protein
LQYSWRLFPRFRTEYRAIQAVLLRKTEQLQRNNLRWLPTTGP